MAAPNGGEGVLDELIVAGLRELHNTPPGGRLTGFIDLFVSESAARLDALRTAVAVGDAAAVERLAHSLKGTTANVGARALPRVLDELERRAAAGDLATSEAAVGVVDAELQRVCAALRDEFRPN